MPRLHGDYLQNDAPQTTDGILLVYVQGVLDEEYHKPPRNVVFVTGEVSPSDFQEAFMRLVLKSGELAVKGGCFAANTWTPMTSGRFARRASEVVATRRDHEHRPQGACHGGRDPQ